MADANEQWDWRIYADFAQLLIRKARQSHPQTVDLDGLELNNRLHALDSVTIDLCIKYHDNGLGKTFVFLTNHFEASSRSKP